MASDPIPFHATLRFSALELLPNELKLMILKELHAKISLRNVIHASILFRSLYLDNSEEIYTAIAIRHLIRHGFNPFDDISILEIRMAREAWSIDDVAEALRIVYRACHEHALRKSRNIIRCAVNVCTLVLDVAHAIPWKSATEEKGPKDSDDLEGWARWSAALYPCAIINGRNALPHYDIVLIENPSARVRKQEEA